MPVIPILALPILWQRLLANKVTNPRDSEQDAFRLDLFFPHVKNGIQFFFNFGDFTLPVNPTLSLLAVIGIVLLIKHLYQKKTEFSEYFRNTMMFHISIISLISGVHFMYYLGDYTSTVNNRYSLVHSVLISFFSAYLLNTLYKRKKYKVILIVFTIFLGVQSLQIAIINKHGKSNLLYREFKKNINFFKNQPERNILIFSTRPGMYLAMNYSAQSIPNQKKQNITKKQKLSKHIYQKIYMIQHFRKGKPGEIVPPSLKLKPRYTYLNSLDETIVISELIFE